MNAASNRATAPAHDPLAGAIRSGLRKTAYPQLRLWAERLLAGEEAESDPATCDATAGPVKVAA